MDILTLMNNCFLRRDRGKASALFGAALLCAALPAFAGAEISTNLSIVEKYNSRGDVVRETFVDEQGNSVMAEDKAYCYAEHRYNKFPRVVETTFHDLSGRHVNTAQGYASIKYKWTGLGTLMQEQYVDLKGNLVNCEDGYATLVYEYQGEKVARIAYYDANGNPVRARGSFASQINTIDKEKGYIIKQEYFDEHGKYMLCEAGYAWVDRYYEKKELLSEAFYDADGSLVYQKGKGYARFEATQDHQGRTIRKDYYGADNQPINVRGGYASVVMEYAKKMDRKPVTETYLDDEGQMVRIRDGYARVEYEYNKKNQLIKRTFYDENGLRAANALGYSRERTAYTMYNKPGYTRYYDENDELVIVPSLGYASVEYTYAQKDNLIREVYLDTEGNPITAENGYSAIDYTYKYDEKKKTHYLTDKSFTDPQGNPA